MKLITFQTLDALKELMAKGYLETNPKLINQEKNGATYNWVIEKMNQIVHNPFETQYPIWCWVKFKNGICPPKRKGDPVKCYDVKITFNKRKEEVFVTDFRRYSFLLNNVYIPKNKLDLEKFNNRLQKFNITNDDLRAYIRKDKYKSHRTDKEFLSVCKDIRNSFDRCITLDSDILQGCVWRINLEDVETIEFIVNDKEYRYGSVNYVRSNGNRFNWIEDFYKKI